MGVLSSEMHASHEILKALGIERKADLEYDDPKELKAAERTDQRYEEWKEGWRNAVLIGYHDADAPCQAKLTAMDLWLAMAVLKNSTHPSNTAQPRSCMSF